MNELLLYIINYCSDLYYKFNFKFIYSSYYEGDNSSIVLSNESVSLMFLRDRGQLLLDFYINYKKENEDYFSIDLVRELITGERNCVSLLNNDNGGFIRNNIYKIVNLFKKENLEDTIKKLKKLEGERSKRLWSI